MHECMRFSGLGVNMLLMSLCITTMCSIRFAKRFELQKALYNYLYDDDDDDEDDNDGGDDDDDLFVCFIA